MIIDYFIRNLKCSQEYFCNNIKVIIDIKKEKLTLFRNKKYWISLIIVNENEITYNIKNICNFLIDIFLEKTYPNNKISINANWYIFGNIVNKNIFDKINIKDNIRYKNVHNKFALINNINGELLFNPGKIENNVISERMKFLCNYLQTENSMNEKEAEQFSKEIKDVYQVLELILNDFK